MCAQGSTQGEREERPALASMIAGTGNRALRHPSFAIGAALCLLLIATAALSLFWTPWPSGEMDIPHKLAMPSAEHWFGTDSLGRDVLSLIMAGARNSILVGVIAVAIGLIAGTLVGTLAAAV